MMKPTIRMMKTTDTKGNTTITFSACFLKKLWINVPATTGNTTTTKVVFNNPAASTGTMCPANHLVR